MYMYMYAYIHMCMYICAYFMYLYMYIHRPHSYCCNSYLRTLHTMYRYIGMDAQG